MGRAQHKAGNRTDKTETTASRTMSDAVPLSLETGDDFLPLRAIQTRQATDNSWVHANEFSSFVHRTGVRLAAAVAGGLVAGLVTVFAGAWDYAPLVGWLITTVIFLSWTWLVVGRLDAAQTRRYATREDPTRFVSHVFLVAATVASLGAVALLLLQAGHAKGVVKVALVAFVLVTIALSWLMLQTLFTLHYAHLYFAGSSGGINFNQEAQPQFTDFAYLAVTLGATFQVSDTNIEDHAIRMVALRHCLLSYLFGVVVLAATVNLISSLL